MGAEVLPRGQARGREVEGETETGDGEGEREKRELFSILFDFLENEKFFRCC